MNVVSIFSTKGGVGKSTLCANLSVALSLLGHPVLALDLDPQNGLRVHFDLDTSEADGLVPATLEDRPWEHVMHASASEVGLLPFGDCSEDQIEAFESLITADHHWLHTQLDALDLGPDTIVMIDTPPGSSAYLRQALTASQLAIAVISPDAATFATMPQFNKLLDGYCRNREDFLDFGLIINQVDPSRRLAKDIHRVLHASLADHIIGAVHTDQAISEALAFRQSVFQYSPDSEAAHDIARCAQWIQAKLEQRSHILRHDEHG